MRHKFQIESGNAGDTSVTWTDQVLTYHYSDVIMSVMASQITGVSIVYSIVCSGAHQRKHQSSASLAFVKGIHRWPVNSLHKGPVTRKMFPLHDVIIHVSSLRCTGIISVHIQKWYYQRYPSITRMYLKKMFLKLHSLFAGVDESTHHVWPSDTIWRQRSLVQVMLTCCQLSSQEKINLSECSVRMM